jgi:N-acetylglucosaminyldiphosphoundecaprenol N-acetyl-beta-D-mannosaminyltransferase
MHEFSECIDGWIASGERHYVCTADVPALMECQRDYEVMRIYNGAGMVTPDGMPLVWLLRINGHPAAERVCGPDLLPQLFSLSEIRGYRHFLYSSSATTLALLRDQLERRFPRAIVAGSHSPPFWTPWPDEDDAILRLINDAEPDIVWVGLGAPKQDRWMAAHRDRLSAAVLIGVGAAFEMLAGTVRRAPPFIRQAGCE